MNSDIDPIILGHNQFIGVSHLSQEVARTGVERFSDIKKAVDIIKICSDMGVNGMMLSTHHRAKDILDLVADEGLSDKLKFYPLIPYAQGYVRKVNEVGIIGLLNEILKPAGMSDKFKILFKGGISFLRKDFIKLLETLLDIELLAFNGFNVKAIFLHNVLTDLGLALQAEEIFGFYIDHIKENYNVVPAFGTMNFAKLVKSFDEWGIKKPLVMASFNKVGFQMNPSREECELILRDYDVDILAMSTLAAGYLNPKDAYEYLFSLPKIKSVVVGVSTREHAEETFNIINQYRGK
ncbi:MAG: hypothetical protein PHS47_01295 [Methanocellales archaeon]|nr:hypothetical protein [Methanocellales archaeon]MDD4897784.1 hypothetical protein [Methanocellales archaeon]